MQPGGAGFLSGGRGIRICPSQARRPRGGALPSRRLRRPGNGAGPVPRPRNDAGNRRLFRGGGDRDDVTRRTRGRDRHRLGLDTVSFEDRRDPIGADRVAVHRLSLHLLYGTSVGKAGAGEGRLGIAATDLRVSDPTIAFFAAALVGGSVLWGC